MASRGEIALRVIRACRELGVRSLALVAGRRARRHRRARGRRRRRGADATWTPRRSPSRPPRAARRRSTPATASSPSRPSWPRPAAPRASSSSGRSAGRARHARAQGRRARAGASAAGVPVVPRRRGRRTSVGYPLLVKARAGGGGRGMRVVRERRASWRRRSRRRRARPRRRSATAVSSTSATSRAPATSRCRSCATRTAPASTSASATARCSAATRRWSRRRPRPASAASLRGELGAAALRLAEAVGYVGAGTAEFLLAPDGSWYFLEMNARIQVEHPVTELVTGIDLVRAQLEIAAGQAARARSRATCCCAATRSRRASTPRTPTHGFLPTSGTRPAPCAGRAGRASASTPASTAATRSGTRYDGLLAKLCVHGETRARALARLRAALDDVVVLGLTTNLPAPALRSRRIRTFERGAVDTGWLERDVAAGSRRRHGPRRRWPPPTRTPRASSARARGRAAGARACARPEPALPVGARRRRRAARLDGGRDVRVRARRARPSPSSTRGAAPGAAAAGARRSPRPCRAPCCGWTCAEGDEVEEREPLLVLEAMKMEHPVWAPFAGRRRRTSPAARASRSPPANCCWNRRRQPASVATCRSEACDRSTHRPRARRRGRRDPRHRPRRGSGRLARRCSCGRSPPPGAAILYATRRIWLGLIASWRSRRPADADPPAPPEGAGPGCSGSSR